MLRYLPLLLLLLLCTCVRAQTGTEVPQGTRVAGSGSLVVNIFTDTWEVTVSSSDYYERYRFVAEHEYRRRPARYDGYSVVRGLNRYDLRPVHRIVSELVQDGWTLLNTNYDRSDYVYNDISQRSFETIHHQFSVPTFLEAVSFNNSVVPVSVSSRNEENLRGTVELLGNGNYRLILEERHNNQWKNYYTLTGEGPLSEEHADRLRSIELSENLLILEFAAEEGTYNYHFKRSGFGYFFEGMSYRNPGGCGIIQYSLTLVGTTKARGTGFFLRHPCATRRTPTSLLEEHDVPRTSLDAFQPGANRLDKKVAGQVVTY